jgi:hypothetical protein
MRVIATQGDVYGPSAGLAKQQSTLNTGDAPQASLSVPTSQKIPQTALFANLQNSVFDNPMGWLIALALFFLIWKQVEETRGTAESFHEIKIGAGNIVKIGGLAFLFALVMKFLSRRYLIPGFSPLVGYVYGRS